nr:MAG: hypothetical protein 2 [Leviviridae sp.]
MFSDPTAVTIDSVAKNLIKINQDAFASEYLLKETDGEFRLRMRHSEYKRSPNNVTVERHNVELTHTLYGATTADPPIIRKTYVVFEIERGDDIAAAVSETIGLADFLAAAGIVAKLANWES